MMKLHKANEELDSMLYFLDLPEALEDSPDESVPVSLFEQSKAVRVMGGASSLSKMICTLPGLMQINIEMLNEIEHMLRDEKESDDQLREQFKERWSRTPSDKLTETFKTNIAKYRELINRALKADRLLRNKFEIHRRGMELLSKDPEDLRAYILSCGGGSAAQHSSAVRQLIEQVETLKAERDKIEQELKTPALDMKSKFLAALSQDKSLNEQALAMEMIGQLFGPLQNQVKDSLLRQESLLRSIDLHMMKLIYENSCAAQRRESAIKELAVAHDAFMELNNKNLKEGSKFYNDLSLCLFALQLNVSDFRFSRWSEKEQLLRDVTQSLGLQKFGNAMNTLSHHTVEEQPPAKSPVSIPAPVESPVPIKTTQTKEAVVAETIAKVTQKDTVPAEAAAVISQIQVPVTDSLLPSPDQVEKEVRERRANEVDEEVRKQSKEAERQEEIEEYRRKLEYGEKLHDQMLELDRRRKEAYQEFLKEKKMMDEIVQRIQEEDMREIEERMRKIKKTKEEIEEFQKAREIWRDRERAQIEYEDKRLHEYIQEQERAEKERLEKFRLQEAARTKVSEKIALELYEKEKEKEREAIILDLLEEQARIKEEKKEQEKLEKELKRRVEVRMEQRRYEEQKLQELRQETEREALERQQLLEKYAENEKLERLTAEKKRIKMLECQRAIENELEERRVRRAEEMKNLILLRKLEVEEKRSRKDSTVSHQVYSCPQCSKKSKAKMCFQLLMMIIRGLVKLLWAGFKFILFLIALLISKLLDPLFGKGNESKELNQTCVCTQCTCEDCSETTTAVSSMRLPLCQTMNIIVQIHWNDVLIFMVLCSILVYFGHAFAMFVHHWIQQLQNFELEEAVVQVEELEDDPADEPLPAQAENGDPAAQLQGPPPIENENIDEPLLEEAPVAPQHFVRQTRSGAIYGAYN